MVQGPHPVRRIALAGGIQERDTQLEGVVQCRERLPIFERPREGTDPYAAQAPPTEEVTV